MQMDGLPIQPASYLATCLLACLRTYMYTPEHTFWKKRRKHINERMSSLTASQAEAVENENDGGTDKVIGRYLVCELSKPESVLGGMCWEAKTVRQSLAECSVWDGVQEICCDEKLAQSAMFCWRCVVPVRWRKLRVC